MIIKYNIMSNIKEGDIVMLQHSDSKDIKMTVERIFESVNLEQVANCIWFVDGDLKRETIALAALKIV